MRRLHTLVAIRFEKGCVTMKIKYSHAKNTLLSREQFNALSEAKHHLYRAARLKSYLAAVWNIDAEPVKEEKIEEVLKSVGIEATHEPRNVGEIDQLFEKLTYYLGHKEPVMDKYIEYGFSVAYKKFARPKRMVEDGVYLRPIVDKEEMRAAIKQDKASGAPFFTQKGFVFDVVWDRLWNDVIPNNKALQPAAAYYRTTEGGKTRLVWAMSLEAIILEAQFARPLIDKFLHYANPMTIGFWNTHLGDTLSTTMTKRYVYTLDYSKYDMTISRTFILRAFAILGTWFSEEDKKKLHWEKMINNFIYTGIVMPDGHVYYGKDHGVCSGSFFTQLIDSVVNVAVIMAVSKKFGLHLNADCVFVLGDDSIFTSFTWLDLKEMSTWVKEQYGIDIHPIKSEVLDTDICRVFHYLGKYWFLGVPHRPEQELYSRMISPERRRHLSWKTLDKAEESNKMILTIIQAYCADCDEGMKLASVLSLPAYRALNSKRLVNIKTALPGLMRFKLESLPSDNRAGSVQDFTRMGMVGMYMK